ncbi:unnamed protein product [Arabidopsis thaliana]|uniref:(thale cress) hypothetical protein n=1 Tax=Arabidopsis thaliana TaxID=3702 RepID=A0A7G2DPE8_ARATH|nr:unnamed protein product [Arabidopsis thaliana]
MESSSEGETNKISRCKATGSDNPDEDYVEITLEVRDETINTMKAKATLRSVLSGRLKTMVKSLSFASRRLDRSKSFGAMFALRGLRFIAKNDAVGRGWDEVAMRFDKLAVEGKLPKSKFGHCIGMVESSEFVNELFEALVRRRGTTSSSITKTELFEFWEQITGNSFDDRLQIFFDIASANKLSKIKENVDEYAALIMEELDRDNLGYIELHNLETLLLQVPSQSNNSPSSANKRALNKMLSQKLIPTKDRNPVKRFAMNISYFFLENWKRIWVLTLWISICITLFTWKFLQYKRKTVFEVMGYCVTVAKGSAETLKFNMALILLPVCRNTITWLRTKSKLIGSVVPFDDNINFHKVVAFGIAVGIGLHAISHLACDFPRLLHAKNVEFEPMKKFFGDERPENYGWFMKGTDGWTGVTMVVLMLVAYVLAQSWFRRNRANLPKSLKRLTGFNAFWYSHHLFVIVYVLLIVHGYFVYLSKEWYHKTVAVYPGNVLSVYMSKPKGFKYTSGQYIYINCSDVSPLQWHPFSITSASGDDYLSVHIRTLGDWTSQLKSLYSKVCQLPSTSQSGLFIADIGQANNITRFPRLLIDGPYGAPAQDYRNYDVLLLVGLGIGATPLISIIRDVLNNIKNQNSIERGTNQHIKNYVATKRAYFYWVTREQGSLEWFSEVMNEVAEYDSEGMIELHNYCTSVYEEGDARSALITMLQSLHHAKSGIDIVSGTRVRTHFARPNWRSVFKHVAVNHVNQRVGVFYCGNTCIIGELKRLAQDFSRKTTTKFEFHKENF